MHDCLSTFSSNLHQINMINPQIIPETKKKIKILSNVKIATTPSVNSAPSADIILVSI